MVNLLMARIRPNQEQQAIEGELEHVEITPEPSTGSEIDSSGAAVQKGPLVSPTNNNNTNPTPQTPDTAETIWDRAEQFFSYDGACVSPVQVCTKWHERQYSPKRTAKPSSPMARVTSRTHEEIEVSEFHHVKVRLPPTHPIVEPPVEVVRKRKLSDAPIENLVLDVSTLERSISELTMRSSYAVDHNLHSMGQESRRMAYYAVGKYHKIGGPGGNRRCYFTGKFGARQWFLLWRRPELTLLSLLIRQTDIWSLLRWLRGTRTENTCGLLSPQCAGPTGSCQTQQPSRCQFHSSNQTTSPEGSPQCHIEDICKSTKQSIR